MIRPERRFAKSSPSSHRPDFGLFWLHFRGFHVNLADADQQTEADFSLTNLAVHIRVGLSRRFSELAVFDARLYIRVRRIDEPA